MPIENSPLQVVEIALQVKAIVFCLVVILDNITETLGLYSTIHTDKRCTELVVLSLELISTLIVKVR